MQRRWIGAVAGCAVLVSSASLAHANSPASVPEGDGEELIIGMGFTPRSLWASSSTAQQEINISEQINEKLIEFTPDGSGFEPRLATEWVQVDDTTLELTLREGVEFTNGEPFNAESAVYSLGVMTSAPAYVGFTDMIDTFEVVDDYTVRITTKAPTLLHMAALGMGSFQYPMGYFEEVGDEQFGLEPIGTGPYLLDEWVIGQEVALAANPGYWNGAPDIERVVFRSIPEEASRVASLETGEIGMLIDFPLDQTTRMEGMENLQIISMDGNRLFRVTFSTLPELTDTPLADPAVRQALQHAIDVDAIIAGPLQGQAQPLQGQTLTPSFFGFDPERERTTYDPELAMELLAEAGYPDGFPLTFKYTSGRYVKDAEVGQIIAAQLGEVGLDVTQEVLEPGTFLDQLSGLQLNDMFFSGSLPPLDAHYMYYQLACGFRYAYYCNEDVDALIEAGASTADADERLAIYDDMRAIFDADPPGIDLYAPVDQYGATSTLSGFQPRASQFLDVRDFVLG